MYRIGSLCTGYGGLDMAAQSVFGGSLAWWSDIESGPIKVMQHHHPEAPNLGDLKAVDWSTVEPVDILTAGYPCQPFSNAGKRRGTDDPRHIWPWIARAIGVLRPRFVVLENVAAHIRRGFDVVSEDLASLGYDTAWSVVRASDVGAPHRRERLFVVAWDSQSGKGFPESPSESGEHPGHVETGGSISGDGCPSTVPDPSGVGWREGRPESAGVVGGPDVAERGSQAVADSDGLGVRAEQVSESGCGRSAVSGFSGEGTGFDWQQYTPAIRRWEAILGVPAPRPDARGPRGGLKVNPAFAEWLMGVPGRITSVPGLSINEQLRLAGNGVVPQQAEHAIRGNLSRLFD